MTRLECCIQLYSLIVGYKYELLKLMGLTPAFWKHVLCELKPFRKLADFILSTSLSHVYCPPPHTHTHTHSETRRDGDINSCISLFVCHCRNVWWWDFESGDGVTVVYEWSYPQFPARSCILSPWKDDVLTGSSTSTLLCLCFCKR